MEADRAALAFYRYIESKFGQSLSDPLIRWILRLSADEVHEMGGDLFAKTYRVDWTLPSLAPGELRPAFVQVPRFYRGTAPAPLQMLLLVPTVVESSYRLNPFAYGLHDAYRRRLETTVDEAFEREKPFIEANLKWLLENQSSVEDGSIQFASPDWAIAKAAIVLPGLMSGELENEREGTWSSYQYDFSKPGADFDSELGLSAMQMTTLTTVGRGESQALDAVLSGQHLRDRRVSQLSTLATVAIPSLEGSQSALRSARKSDAYEEFRIALQQALASVEDLPEGQEAEAGALVAALVRGSLPQLEKAVQASPALAALRTAGRGLALVAVGASAGGLATGNALGAIVGGGVTKLSEAGLAYLEARKSKRRAKAVWDLVLKLGG